MPSAELSLSRALPGPLLAPDALPLWLERSGLVAAPDLLRARKRMRAYGGTLDTALLELGLCDEATVSQALEQATGLPAPKARWLRESTGKIGGGFIDRRDARRLMAQPLWQTDRKLEIAIVHDADPDAVVAWARRQHQRGCRFYIVSQLRFEALLARAHDVPLPPRFLHLLARLGQSDRAVVRRQSNPRGDITPPPLRLRRRIPGPPVETGPNVFIPAPEPEIEVVEDLTETGFATPANLAALPDPLPPDLDDEASVSSLIAAALEGGANDEERGQRLARLRPFLHDPQLADCLAKWRTQAAGAGLDARPAINALVEVRDGECVPDLIALLDAADPLVAEAALAALQILTMQDFGPARWRWMLWWRTWGKKHRVEWLLEALSAQDPERRLHAAQELESVSGHYVGYHFDLGRRERQAARRRWQRWWEQTGKARFGRPH